LAYADELISLDGDDDDRVWMLDERDLHST
jgi:hypothetical protein